MGERIPSSLRTVVDPGAVRRRSVPTGWSMQPGGNCGLQRAASLLPLLHNYQSPEHPINGSIAPTDRFRAAVQDAKIGPDKDIPHISAPVIVKYVTDLELLGLL